MRITRSHLLGVVLPLLEAGHDTLVVADALGIYNRRILRALEDHGYDPTQFKQTATPLEPNSLNLSDLIAAVQKADPEYTRRENRDAALEELWKKGLSYERMSAETGITRTMIQRIAISKGWPPRGKRRHHDITREQLLAL